MTLLRLTHSIPQSASFTPFSKAILAISHFALLILIPENREKVIKFFYDFSYRIHIFHKKVVSSAYAVYRKLWLNIFRPSILLFVLIKVKAISKTKIKRYAEIGSPCQVPLSSLKKQVVFPPFTTHNF